MLKVVLCLLFCFVTSESATVCSSLGSEFMFAFMMNDPVDGSQDYIYVLITNDNPSPVSISLTAPFSKTNIASSVPAYDTLKITLDAIALPVHGGNFSISSRGVYISASGPVRVFAGSEVVAGYSADAFPVYPISSLGTNYLGATFAFDTTMINQLIVVGTEDGTWVKFSGPVFASTVTQTVDRFGVISLSTILKDFTGVEISSNKPIALISGEECALQPGSDCDLSVTMLLPTPCWGTEFVMSSMLGSDVGNTFTVIAASDYTVVQLNKNLEQLNTTINAQGQYSFTLGANSSAFMSSNNPVQLVMKGEHNQQTDYGDPSLSQVIPLNQYSGGTVLFHTIGYYANTYPWIHFINIITKEEFRNAVYLDGVSPGGWVLMNGSGFAVTRQSIGNGTHNITCEAAGCSFYGLAYGYTKIGGYSFSIATGEPSSAQFCNGHGTAYCSCQPGYSGPTCNVIAPNITNWLAPRCALYATTETKQNGIPVGCEAPPNSKIVCDPDNSNCLLEPCDNPLGWCIPLFNDTSLEEENYQLDRLKTTKRSFGLTNQACSGHGTQYCTCDFGYDGPNCQNKEDPCKLAFQRLNGNACAALCGPHGTFVGNLTTGQCICQQGFTGEFCDQPIPSQVRIAHRCALYSNACTGNTKIGCDPGLVCWPDDVRCSLDRCQCPWGWCLPKPVVT